MKRYTEEDVERLGRENLDRLLTITRDQEHEGAGASYRKCTGENARESDITILFTCDLDSPHTRLIMESSGGRCSLVPIGPRGYTPEQARIAILKDILKHHIDGNSIRVNITGSGIRSLALSQDRGMVISESAEDGIQEMADRYVREVLEMLRSDGVGIREIVSGGQTGIEMAGARSGLSLNIPTHVHMPADYLTRDIHSQDIQHTQEQIRQLYQSALKRIAISRKTPADERASFSTYSHRRFQPDVLFLGDTFKEYQRENGPMPEFANTESAFQYMKGVVSIMSGELAKDEERHNRRLMAKIWKDGGDGNTARELGHELILTQSQRASWEDIEADVLKSLTTDSFAQNGDALSSLLLTGSSEFITMDPSDGLDGIYPIMLMDVRSQLRKAVSAQSTTTQQWCCVSINATAGQGAAREILYNYIKPDGTLFSPEEWLKRTGPFVGDCAQIQTRDDLTLSVGARDGGHRCAEMIRAARPKVETTHTQKAALHR